MTARDPRVLAVYAVHLTAAEVRSILAGQPIRRPFWPPQRCQGGAVVGLCAGGFVVGEAELVAACATGEDDPARRVEWVFSAPTVYLRALAHPGAVGSRAMSSAMPPAPVGTVAEPAAQRLRAFEF